MDHELTIIRIKSNLLDLWNDSTAGFNYAQWFDATSPILDHFFEIKQASFFIFDKNKNSFISLEGHQSLSKRRIEVPSELIASKRADLHEAYIELFKRNGFEFADEIVVYSNEEFEPLALLLVKSTDKWRAFSVSPYSKEFEYVISNFIRIIEKINFLERREKRFRQLFNVAELFNSTMSSQVILEGIMDSITESFPSFEINLLLSQDQKEQAQSYKLFDYMNERTSTIEAFISGEVTMEEAVDRQVNLINAPIKGRQGIYGVLQIKTPLDYVFSSTQTSFIRMLAKTAGSALENASLYDQSHRLVEDLQLVNETSQKLNSSIRFDEMISYLKKQLFKAIQPNEIVFVLNNEDNTYDVLKESTDFFRTIDGEEYVNFVSNYLISGKEFLFDANFSTTMKKPVGYESVIAVPITNQAEVIGFIICAHMTPYAFSFDNFKLVSLLISHSSLSLANSRLRDQLQNLVDKDYLTKLYARRYLDNMIEKSITQNEGGALLLLDIDDFKEVNDTFGHSVGDNVLKQIASFLLLEVEGDCVAARWGGEEFAIYLPAYSQIEAEKVAAKFIKKIPVISTPAVTVSAGMACWLADQGTTFRDLFKYTDSALYEAKNKGKNQIIIHG